MGHNTLETDDRGADATLDRPLPSVRLVGRAGG